MIDYNDLNSIMVHKGKMLLLNRVIDYNSKEQSIRAESDITEQCIFYDPALGGVPSWVGFEFIAQAIAALSGIKDMERGIKPKIGFILSVPSMKIMIPLFKLGSTIKIYTKVCDSIDTIYTFEGEIYIEDKKALTGKMMLVEVNENDERFKSFLTK